MMEYLSLELQEQFCIPRTACIPLLAFEKYAVVCLNLQWQPDSKKQIKTKQNKTPTGSVYISYNDKSAKYCQGKYAFYYLIWCDMPSSGGNTRMFLKPLPICQKLINMECISSLFRILPPHIWLGLHLMPNLSKNK